MSPQRQSPGPTEPRAIPVSGPANESHSSFPLPDGDARANSIARLASPIPSIRNDIRSTTRSIETRGDTANVPRSELPGSVRSPPDRAQHSRSALAAAIQSSQGSSTAQTEANHLLRNTSPERKSVYSQTTGPDIQYGSFESRSGPSRPRESTASGEDPRIVRRHLVQPKDTITKHTRFVNDGQESANDEHPVDEIDHEAFSSLKLQGGDMTRAVYRWSQDTNSSPFSRHARRSKSWHLSRPEPEDETLNINSIRVPGGFRRDHLRRRAPSPPSRTNGGPEVVNGDVSGDRKNPQNFISRNFLEFLTLYGHFAGEELEDEDEDDEAYFDPRLLAQGGEHGAEDSDAEYGEGSALLTPGTPGRRKRRLKERGAPGTNTTTGAALLLLKSFVGTGVLFLPKAYLNGGMLFSNLVLLGVAMLSYYCFILLVRTRLKVNGSFGDIGGILYGKWLRITILASVVLSQIGFVSAYIVFTSESMQAFFTAVSDHRTWVDIRIMVVVQLIIFLPLSLIRDISKLGVTALIADAFILLGLIYLGYFDIYQIVSNHGVADIVPFNSNSWTLFIGTAIFTFEGVGLIIPIQESMKEPAKFPPVLAGVMIIITVVFMVIGALSYAAFGSATRTVVLLNLPQQNKLVNAVQLLYSLAILLSTPLQLFPAIRIMEGELFSKSGKYSSFIKWQKNLFRFLLVIGCALIAWGGAGDLDKFVSLVGSFACVPLIYVYPAMLHYRAVARTRRQKVLDCILCLFGLVAMVYTTVQTIRSWVSSPGERPGRR